MRYAPKDKHDLEDLEKLNAAKWQVDLLSLNPEYLSWGPYEDGMWKEGEHWDCSMILPSWKEFGPWKLDSYNEVVNFYFSVRRKNEPCKSCDQSGYSPKAKIIADAWYDFDRKGTRWCDRITDHEVAALVKANRLMDLTHVWTKKNGWQPREYGYIPTAAEVNAWERGPGIGHDAINRIICIRARCEKEDIELHCPECEGKGHIYTEDKAHVSLTLWMLHPRKGVSRGLEVTRIKEEELPDVFAFLRDARDRNADRFSKIPEEGKKEIKG